MKYMRGVDRQKYSPIRSSRVTHVYTEWPRFSSATISLYIKCLRGGASVECGTKIALCKEGLAYVGSGFVIPRL